MTTASSKPVSTLFNSIVGDLNSGAKRLANNPILIEQIPDALIGDLKEKLTKYSPMTQPGKENKTKALNNIDARVAELQSALNNPNVEVVQEQPFEAVVEAEKVIQNTVVLELHLRQPGFGKSVKKDSFEQKYEIEELPTNLAIYQMTIDKRHLKPLISAKIELISWLKARAMPSGFLANGMYLVPLSLISLIDEKINNFKMKQEELLNEFEANYPDIIEEAKQHLGKVFNPANYPDFSVIKAGYRVDAKYLTLNVPAALEKVNKDLFDKEREKSQQMWADATQDIRDGLRTGFKQLVDHFVGKLGKDENGKQKVFHGSTVEKLKDFVSTFADRNLTNDSELAALAEDAKALLNNVDPKAIRKDEAFRESIAEEFAKIKDIADRLIVSKTRKIDLED